MHDRILFLSWESPYPAHSGAALRTSGLLQELNKRFDIDLLVLTRYPLSGEQTARLGELTRTVTRVPLRDVSFADKVRVVAQMFVGRLPYHSALLLFSLRDHPDIWRRIESFSDVVFTSTGHWGTLVRDRRAPNWILNQCDADVEFWRVYASQATHPLVKAVALVNWRLSGPHFRQIYRQVGRIISVCEDDKHLTQQLAPDAQIDVIENGIDCAYYVPNRESHSGRPPRLLFTGTSAARNITVLRRFTQQVLPLIQKQVPDIEFLVAGNFRPKAQVLFKGIPGIRFTGKVDDIRPFFDQSDVYVAPFQETHGSKLKIAEAMAMGMAIVSTPEGIRGFPLVDGESVMIAESDKQFVNHVIALLRNFEMQRKLGASAREVAMTTIDWQVLGERLSKIAESMWEYDE